MVVGKRLIQSATDIFAGFTSLGDGNYYVRQFRDPIAIDAYIGRGRRFDAALGEFAVAYADQTARDHRRLSEAIADPAIYA